MACCTYINARKDFFRFSEIFDNLEPENMNFWDKLDPKHH